MRDDNRMNRILDQIKSPDDLKGLEIAQLEQVADEIRDRIVEVMPVVGGHFGSGLGITDLTVALHRVFDFKRDQFVLDVSHQCYPHKILTGRNHWYDDIRTKGGPAGYTRPDESPYDWWHVGPRRLVDLDGARSRPRLPRRRQLRGRHHRRCLDPDRHGDGGHQPLGRHPRRAPDRHPERQRHGDRAHGRRHVASPEGRQARVEGDRRPGRRQG